MEDGKHTPPIELILLIPYHYVFCTYKYMIYSQIMSLNPRERSVSHPSGHPPPSLRLPKAGPVPDPDQPFPWIRIDQIPKLVHVLKPALYYLKYIDLRFLILIFGLYLNSSAHIDYPVTLHVI